MAAFDKESYKEREERYRTDEIDHGRFAAAATPDPDDDSLIDDDDDLDDADLDDDTTIGDDGFDDDDLEDEDLDDDDLVDTNYSTITSEEGIESGSEDPDETPELEEADDENETGFDEGQTNPQEAETDGSYSEQIDVTPPTPHEFPSVGHAQTSFESRPHGRTTGRMVGHEPGTEGI